MATAIHPAIIQAVLDAYPNTQAIYLFGSWGTDEEWPDSDVDIALLLRPDEAKGAACLPMESLRFALESLLSKPVDLVNLRLAPTVLQKEVIFANRRIHCANEYAADEFEMLTLSYYQTLNEERKEIMDEFWRTGIAQAVRA